MGEATYYLKARFKSPAAAKKAEPLVLAFLQEAEKAGDYWQKNRGGISGPAKKADQFWKDFADQFPLVTKYLKAPLFRQYKELTKGKWGYTKGEPLFGGDHNNGLAGNMSFGSSESEDNLSVNGAVLAYHEYTWHLASWDELCAWLKIEFGATEAKWLSEEYANVSDLLEV